MGGDTVGKQKHPTHKNMWQELSNDTIPKGSAIYPSKDKLSLRPLKLGKLLSITSIPDIKKYYIQLLNVFFIKRYVMKVDFLLLREKKHFFHPLSFKAEE